MNLAADIDYEPEALAQAFSRQIILDDLTIKEVAEKIRRGNTTVLEIKRGHIVSKKTLVRIRIAFPSLAPLIPV